ncbi:hypothetical protein IPL85_04385 [Candidatus Saccharibacteria bacterium]|nr:MAG: hypothetical protein IPL85_04385 [Candidatus Saccharibacteria bacterium]
MKPRATIYHKLEQFGDIGTPIFLVNPHSTRAKKGLGYVGNAIKNHPFFAAAAVVATSAAINETIKMLQDRLDTGKTHVVIPVGGDTTFNQAAMAVEGSSHVLVAIQAGNATNAALNLQKQGRRILLPHEVLEQGSVKTIRPIDMRTDGSRRIAFGLSELGLMSNGAKFLNGPLRSVPGYHNDVVRNFLHERTLLVGRSLFNRRFPLSELIEHDGEEQLEERNVLSFAIARLPRIGHHAFFPQVSLERDAGFAFELPSHRELLRYTRDIQNGTLDGQVLQLGHSRAVRVGRTILGSVDGDTFPVEQGEIVSFAISSRDVNVFGLDEPPQALAA